MLAEEMSHKDIDKERVNTAEMKLELQRLRRKYLHLKNTPLQHRLPGRLTEMSLILKKGKEIRGELDRSESYKSIRQYLSEDAELAEALVLKLIMDLYLFLNVSHSFNPEQFRPTAKMILAKCKGLTLEDVSVCFHKVKASEYKPSYGRLDGQVILGWLNEYKKDRLKRHQEQQQNLHLSQQFYSERLNERILKRTKKVGK